ncbi:MAG: DUF4158 domain-containing protein [Acetobacteraceae bacterium]|nr:DUF4158 domain-containing protein [Acetobacteraceae bacterium]
MPRRRALTEAQLEDLLALPTTDPDLIQYWTLSRDDLAAIERRRGAHNQLGYALQLCAFRYPGRLLRPGDAIPETTLRFVAEQIPVSADALAAYAGRPQTRREQLDALREAFGFRMFAPGHGRPGSDLQHRRLRRLRGADHRRLAAGNARPRSSARPAGRLLDAGHRRPGRARRSAPRRCERPGGEMPAGGRLPAE